MTTYIPWATLSDTDSKLFRDTMCQSLRDISIPYHALYHNSTMCDNQDCLLALETFYVDIVSAVGMADHTLPRRKHGLGRSFWTPELDDLKKQGR